MLKFLLLFIFLCLVPGNRKLEESDLETAPLNMTRNRTLTKYSQEQEIINFVHIFLFILIVSRLPILMFLEVSNNISCCLLLSMCSYVSLCTLREALK